MHLSPNDRPSTHSIYHPDDDVRIPLELVGVISTVETRTPSQHELDTCKWATLANISEAHDCLKRWGIGVETATNTLKVTTQKRI